MTKPNQDEFDVIVVGAGMAGLCCAGELVLQGARVLLLPETKEVGVAVRPHMVDGNRGIMQGPTNMIGWGGGWWLPLARRLNADISIPDGFNAPFFDWSVEGLGQVWPVTQCSPTPAAMAKLIGDLFGRMDAGLRDQFLDDGERVLTKALAIPYAELARMDRVPTAQWVEDQKTNPAVALVINALSMGVLGSTMEFATEHISMLGTFGILRAMLCGEANFGFPYPDNRDGMAIPLAKAIEGNGGTIWRGRKVAELGISNNRVDRVLLADGTEARAPLVALACGNPRIAAILDPLPPEAEPAITYSTKYLPHRDFHLFSVMNEPVLPQESRRWVGVLPTGGYMSWFAPMHALIPWSVKEPGTQFVLGACAIPVSDVEQGKYGTEDQIYGHLTDLMESIWPGYQRAAGTTERAAHKSGHLWFEPLCAGPKLPRTIDSVSGLWFVGEGSAPTEGVWMEASASAGILGARQMASQAKGQPGDWTQ